MIVWPVSLSIFIRKDGSSPASCTSAFIILSPSAFVFGSIATEMTGSGKRIDSSCIRCFASQSVSPVWALFSPTTATMSPVKISLISSRLFACILKNLLTRSLRSLEALMTWLPASQRAAE